jgi:hypothetical protein
LLTPRISNVSSSSSAVRQVLHTVHRTGDKTHEETRWNPVADHNFGERRRAHAAECDRVCLGKMVDTYLAAVVAHDPARVPFALNLRFVENTVPMKPGEGLWKTASAAPTTFKIYVPDPVVEQVGFLGVMREGDKPIELGLRLKLTDGKITEAEHLIARNLRETSLANMNAPRPGLLATIPLDQRVSRDRMLKIRVLL